MELISIQIETDGDSFYEDPAGEVSILLRRMAVKISNGAAARIMSFRDTNGNTICHVIMSNRDADKINDSTEIKY